MRRSAAKAITATLAVSLITASAASAANGALPPPTSPTGNAVTLVAAGGGLTTPTRFALRRVLRHSDRPVSPGVRGSGPGGLLLALRSADRG